MKNIKKWLSILLCLAAVLSISVPGVSAEETTETADDYVFPEFSKPVYLGEPLTGEMSITEDIEIINHNGKDYILVAAKGGTLYVFKLTDFMEKYKPNSDVELSTKTLSPTANLKYTVGVASNFKFSVNAFCIAVMPI